MLITQTISLSDALKSINLQVIGFLFGMFSIISAYDRSGILKHVAFLIITKAKTPGAVMAVFVIGLRFLLAFLVNDTIALLGVPIIIYISKHLAIKPKPPPISLVFGI
ncbi:MAG: SLC13 family permease [Thermoproteota archaeon]|nr:SLC13 family permease [Thermoproteota archaeon]